MDDTATATPVGRRKRQVMMFGLTALAIALSACVPAAGGSPVASTKRATSTTRRTTTTIRRTTTTTKRPTTTTAKPTTTTAKPTTTTAKPTTTTAKPTTTARPTTTTTPDQATFDITTRVVGATTTQASLIQQAAQRWESVVVADVPASTTSFSAGACVSGAPAYSGTIDDLLVDVVIMPIDGAGGILGQAGPCFVREADNLPLYGIILLDSADAADLVSSNYFGAVVVHEVGHILGFGTLWNYSRSLLDTTNSSDPRFVGPAATSAWHAIGGTGFVPVEANGGGGTALSHWSESVFSNELMTGYLSQTNQLSRVTIGSLSDMGYTTDANAADPYGLPGISARQMAAVLDFELAPTQPGPPPAG